VDLFGEHSVQVMVPATHAVLETVLVLTLATLLVLLSVRLVQQSAPAWATMLAIAPSRMSRIASPARAADADIRSARRRALSTSLPTRAPPPPDPVQRFCPSLAGERFSG
jgi:hypothetical protein